MIGGVESENSNLVFPTRSLVIVQTIPTLHIDWRRMISSSSAGVWQVSVLLSDLPSTACLLVLISPSALRCGGLGLILHPLEWICIQAELVEHTIAPSTFSIYLVVVKK